MIKWAMFQEPNFDLPNVFIENYLKDFDKATNGLLSITVIELDATAKMKTALGKSFQFSLLLRAKFVYEYAFEILKFGYDVQCYPVILSLDHDIAFQLKRQKGNVNPSPILGAVNQTELESALDVIFSTEKFKVTVGGLMKISNQRNQKNNA